MTRFLTLALLALALFAHGETAQKKSSSPDKENVKEGPSTDGPPVAAVSSIEETDIQGFEHYAPQIQELIRQSLALTKLNLTYTFGSADPKNGGMDCSGAIFFVLSDFGFKGVPRQSNEMAGWVKEKTLLHRVEKADSLSHPEFSSLQPGNLLFWSGTYEAGPREIPVTHVMLYLGKLKKSGKHVVFGASDGRAYQGKRRTGVSVFDFSLPRSTSSATFYGYGMIPGVGKIEVKEKSVEPVVVAEKTEPKPAPVKPQETAKAQSAPVTKTASESKEKPPEPKMAATTVKEEVRPAIPVEKKPAPITAKAEPPPVKKTEAKTVAAKPAATAKPATAKPKSSAPAKSTSSKPKVVAKRKPAPPPPTPLERARQATTSFFKDVRKNFP
ncbi:NlpC/P60 family protein [Prosthecobacter sp. SYSU 5D2]|uniref:NlpC/P60 family protein n=1 Tax=Prosthecobacter sp. SYSU 5D2 TaxID=3134134 RepID=UPI0031FEF20B